MDKTKPIKLLLWGIGTDWNRYIGRLKQLSQVGEDIVLVGVTSSGNAYFEQMDGVPFIQKDAIRKEQYDYILAIPQKQYGGIREEARMMGIAEDRILLSQCLDIEGFSFQRYLALRDSRPTIICNNCWGGVTYHHLHLPFFSPFINMFLRDADFLRLLTDLKGYLAEELHYERTSYNPANGIHYPVFRLGGVGDACLHMNHYRDTDEAKVIWKRRLARINWDNLFIMMYTKEKDVARRFSEMTFAKKVCFVPKKTMCFPSCMLVRPYAERIPQTRELWEDVIDMASGNLPYYDAWELLMHGKFVYRTGMQS